jgi:hypothetical protein
MNMKFFKIVVHLIPVATLVAISTPAISQTLFDIYKALPTGVALCDLPCREKMISNHKANKSTQDIHYRFNIADEKNGFLSVTGALEGRWEMSYWNLPNNKKLVAVYQEGCGPMCGIDIFKFFLYENGKIHLENIESVIPGYKTIYEDFFIQDPKASKLKLEDQDIITTLLLQLPRKGKTITAIFDIEGSTEVCSKYCKGNRMALEWNNGQFQKSKIYWDK